jgi:hypothetical protein
MGNEQRKKKYLDLLFCLGYATNTNQLRVRSEEICERERIEGKRGNASMKRGRKKNEIRGKLHLSSFIFHHFYNHVFKL